MKGTQRATLAAILTVVTGFICNRANGFDAEGFRSGMTVEAVADMARQRELTLKNYSISGSFAGYALLKTDRGGNVDFDAPLITLTFCDGGLTGFDHNIDVDVDYIPTLQDLLAKFGNPARVDVSRESWSGPGGGYISIEHMYWYSSTDRIELSFHPEGRTGSGALRYTHGSSISYSSRSKRCPLANW
jgi:hypothetical protein